MRLGLTEKFLAEGQPETGKNGHVVAAVTHRCVFRPSLQAYFRTRARPRRPRTERVTLGRDHSLAGIVLDEGNVLFMDYSERSH